VIVLDDDLFICRALKTQLEILGFDVVVFHTAERLLASKITSPNICVLADVYLPGMSGVELCRRLAAEGSSLPIILMSGRDDDETARSMRDAKPIARLFKPFEQIELLRAVKKAIAKKSRHAQ